MKQPCHRVFTYETNVPPGVGAEVYIESMEPWSKYNLGRRVLQFAKSCKRDPEIWAKVKAREAELRASGFFEQHPPKEGFECLK